MRNIVNHAVRGLPIVHRLISLVSARRRRGNSILRTVASVDVRTVMLFAVLVGPAALFIPWLRLDGHTESLSGVGLMIYALQGNDRLVMWRISPLSLVTVMMVPYAIAVAVCLTAASVLRRNCRLDAPLFAVAAILLLLRFAPPILGGQALTMGRFAAPGPGLVVLMASVLVVIACACTLRWSGRWSTQTSR